MPSKIYGPLASGRTVIFIGPARSEAAHLVADDEAGEVVSPDDAGQLVAAILRAAEDPRLHARRSAKATGAAAETTLTEGGGHLCSRLLPLGRTPDS